MTESEPAEMEAPTDFREYVRWRQTGEQPKKSEETEPAAAAEKPPAKTEPQSGAEETQQAEETEEEPEAGKPGRGGSRQRRIDRLTRENESWKQQNEYLRQQLATAQQPRPPQPAAQAPPTPPKPAEAPGKPKLQDFQTLEAYQEALTDWKLDQREAQRKAEAEMAAARDAEQKLQTAWSSSETTARTAHPDYDEVIQSVAAPAGPGVLAARQAMLEDEAGAEILYYLGTHSEELQRIAAMQPVSAIREIGKLSAMLAPSPAAERSKPRTVSSAPRPPAPLSRPSGQTTKPDVLDEDFARRDFKAWSAARIAQIKERGW
ncbi:MAG: hypothetical protein C5B60_11435 [Chloroflexi bacterium]|nr:MAG: hypothetical protein C5B60_11435 [Chloroflexota bacterium]